MFGIALAVLLPAVFIAVVQANKDRTDRRVIQILLAGYILRLVLQTFFREVSVFSYGAGGDWIYYERHAAVVQQFWEHGFHRYITAEDYPDLSQTSLPPNIFGFVYFLNGGPTRVGCGAIIAVTACLTCLNLYYLGLELGVEPTKAFQVFVVMFFAPAFLIYTSDMFKDGLVMFFVTGSFASAIRLTRKFSLLHLALGVLCCFALYGCRFYLVFVTVAPLFIGTVGFGSKNATRQVLVAIALIGGLIFLLGYTKALDEANNTANVAWATGASKASMTANAQEGSGIEFDDGGSPLGALHWKVLYTLFAPFPWMGGSLALQIGKIEAIIWYYMLYRAWLASKVLWKENRAMLLMFLSFLVPTTIMYAMVMSNIGLTLRERMSVVYIGYLLGMLSWAKPESLVAGATAPSDAASAPAAEPAFVRPRRPRPVIPRRVGSA